MWSFDLDRVSSRLQYIQLAQRTSFHALRLYKIIACHFVQMRTKTQYSGWIILTSGRAERHKDTTEQQLYNNNNNDNNNNNNNNNKNHQWSVNKSGSLSSKYDQILREHRFMFKWQVHNNNETLTSVSYKSVTWLVLTYALHHVVW